jgi:hypothetical protein
MRGLPAKADADLEPSAGLALLLPAAISSA